jgi:hypothetical protein
VREINENEESEETKIIMNDSHGAGHNRYVGINCNGGYDERFKYEN